LRKDVTEVLLHHKELYERGKADVTMKVLRYKVRIFKGRTARPELVNLHDGDQRANSKAP